MNVASILQLSVDPVHRGTIYHWEPVLKKKNQCMEQ
jgi:hypothetical protein